MVSDHLMFNSLHVACLFSRHHSLRHRTDSCLPLARSLICAASVAHFVAAHHFVAPRWDLGSLLIA